jgi:ribosomal protein L7/L12
MLQEQFKNTLKQLIQSYRTVEAIKLIRDFTGMGLQESKDLFDLFNKNISLLNTYNFDVKAHEKDYKPWVMKSELDESTLYEIKKLLAEDNKVYAVSYLKEIKNITIENAQDLVKEIEESSSSTYNFTSGNINNDLIDTEINKPFTQKSSLTQNKPILNTGIPTIPRVLNISKHKEKKIAAAVSEPIVFAKVAEREKHLRKDRSNSGCLVMFALLIFFGISVAYIFF